MIQFSLTTLSDIIDENISSDEKLIQLMKSYIRNYNDTSDDYKRGNGGDKFYTRNEMLHMIKRKIFTEVKNELDCKD
tara:strand:+ start:217 stop:447 length:231 start_codon:yes stop_codon:yes gene_type:complete